MIFFCSFEVQCDIAHFFFDFTDNILVWGKPPIAALEALFENLEFHRKISSLGCISKKNSLNSLPTHLHQVLCTIYASQFHAHWLGSLVVSFPNRKYLSEPLSNVQNNPTSPPTRVESKQRLHGRINGGKFKFFEEKLCGNNGQSEEFFNQ